LSAQIEEERRKELRKLKHMILPYTGVELTLLASPTLAAVASFCVFAATTDAANFAPGTIFAAVALFGILQPAVEQLPYAFVEASSQNVELD